MVNNLQGTFQQVKIQKTHQLWCRWKFPLYFLIFWQKNSTQCPYLHSGALNCLSLISISRWGWGYFSDCISKEGNLRRQTSHAKFLLFYRGAIESILTGNITNWHGLCTAQDRRTHLPSTSDIGEVRCLCRAQRILKDKTHLSNSLFTLLPSGKQYRSITRLQSSFFPQAETPQIILCTPP